MAAILRLCALLFVVGVCFADVGPQPVTELCLGCLCQAVSGCNVGAKCEGDTCGLFKITWAYWADAGKITLNGEAPDSPTAYSNCANDPYCAASIIQAYMTKFGQDCNGDGQINCYDYVAIHKLGPYGCAGDLPFKFATAFNQCVATVVQQQG